MFLAYNICAETHQEDELTAMAQILLHCFIVVTKLLPKGLAKRCREIQLSIY